MSEAKMVRISVAALTPIVCGGFLQKSHVGIWLDKRKRYGAIGGAVALTPKGMTVLERLGAVNFEAGSDARFKIPLDMVGPVMDFFCLRDKNFYEVSPEREVIEELFTPELDGQVEGILPKLYESGVKVKYRRTTIQPITDVAQRRIFYVYDLHVARSAYDMLKASRHLRFLSKREVATTCGGTKVGMTRDGFDIADNIF